LRRSSRACSSMLRGSALIKGPENDSIWFYILWRKYIFLFFGSQFQITYSLPLSIGKSLGGGCGCLSARIRDLALFRREESEKTNDIFLNYFVLRDTSTKTEIRNFKILKKA
jgi:hypothetical protein